MFSGELVPPGLRVRDPHPKPDCYRLRLAVDRDLDGTCSLGIAYVKVDDILTILDALEWALAEQRAV
ncbi:hypothetical protein [Streptomyces sp. NPDC002758]